MSTSQKMEFHKPKLDKSRGFVLKYEYNKCVMIKKVKQSQYRPGQALSVPRG